MMEEELHRNRRQTSGWILYLADQGSIPRRFQGRLSQRR